MDDCFISVLTHFLKRVQPSPTLSDLVTALQSPPVNQPQLVIKIRELASKVCVCITKCIGVLLGLRNYVCLNIFVCTSLSVHVCTA